MERTRLLRRPLVWIVLVIAGAIALSYLISGGPSYAKWDTSSALVHLRNGDTKSVQIDDKEQTLKLVLKPDHKVTIKGVKPDRVEASISADYIGQLQKELDNLKSTGVIDKYD